MPLRLNNRSTTPPGGWSYRVAETGKSMRGHPSPESLRKALATHCSLHNLPVPGDEQVEDYICKQLGDDALHWCVDAESGEAQAAYRQGGVSCRMTFSQVLSGTRTIGSWLLRGRRRVEGAEAERRARICATCSQNMEIHGCTGCSMPALRDAVLAIVGGGGTTNDPNLKGCCVCGCALKALVWMPLDILHERMPAGEDERLPGHCWKKKTALVAEAVAI